MSRAGQAGAGAEVIDLDPVRRRGAARRDGAPRQRCAHRAGDVACRNYAGPTGYCRVHEPEDAAAPVARPETFGAPPPLDPEDFDEAVDKALAFLRRRLTGDYEVDVFGFDRELTEQVLMPLARPLYQKYWRVRTVGLEHVPSDSGALVVANHAGTLPFDAIMTKMA
ncbi:MAG TPA: hypothetical protein VNU01_05160, partial [Egibacteraceae bacterium]|nr:hypothetical protein [Egibacteraceae bacterium]